MKNFVNCIVKDTFIVVNVIFFYTADLQLHQHWYFIEQNAPHSTFTLKQIPASKGQSLCTKAYA